MLSSPLFPAVVVVVWDGRMGRREVVRGGAAGSGDYSDNVRVCHSRLSSAVERSPGESEARWA